MLTGYLFFNHQKLPVVIIADFIAAGLHEGWEDFTMAASAETCGQDMEVPEIML